MTNVRPLPATSPTATVSAPPQRQRLRAVAPDEVPPVAELLGADATWLPAPQHTLPTLPGQPPMVGYLVLVPAAVAPPQTTHSPAPQPQAPQPHTPNAHPQAGPARPAVGPQAGPAQPAVAGHTLPAAQQTVPAAPPAAPSHEGDRSGSESVAGVRDGSATIFGDGGVRVDAERRTAHVQGRLLELTFLEFELLAHLVAHPQRVHTRDQLVTTVWGYGHVGDGRTVDVHIARLRRKLGAEHRSSIVTVRRVGYKYVPSV